MTRSVNHRCPVSRKFRYAGKTEAGKVAARMTKKNTKAKEANPVVDAYACEHCIGWHVGHQRKAHDRA